MLLAFRVIDGLQKQHEQVRPEELRRVGVALSTCICRSNFTRRKPKFNPSTDSTWVEPTIPEGLWVVTNSHMYQWC